MDKTLKGINNGKVLRVPGSKTKYFEHCFYSSKNVLIFLKCNRLQALHRVIIN